MFIGVYKSFLNHDLLMFIWNSERPPNHDLLMSIWFAGFRASVCLVLDPAWSEDGSESALLGNQLLRLFVHPLDAFCIPTLFDLFPAHFGSEAFRASVGFVLDAAWSENGSEKCSCWKSTFEAFHASTGCILDPESS